MRDAFGVSKMAIVYHGTNASSAARLIEGEAFKGKKVYTTTDRDLASWYAAKPGKSRGKVLRFDTGDNPGKVEPQHIPIIPNAEHRVFKPEDLGRPTGVYKAPTFRKMKKIERKRTNKTLRDWYKKYGSQ